MCQKSAHSLAASTLHKAETAFVTLGEQKRLGFVQPANQQMWNHLLTPWSYKAKKLPFLRMTALSIFKYSLLENSSYCNNAAVCCRRCILDTWFRCTCMYDGIVSNINCNVSTVTYDVTRLHVCLAYFISYTSHCTGGMRKWYTKCCIYAHYESGTVCSVCQAGSTIYIWVSNKLTCIACNCCSITAWRWCVASCRSTACCRCAALLLWCFSGCCCRCFLCCFSFSLFFCKSCFFFCFRLCFYKLCRKAS